jgi:hypothetical protein
MGSDPLSWIRDTRAAEADPAPAEARPPENPSVDKPPRAEAPQPPSTEQQTDGLPVLDPQQVAAYAALLAQAAATTAGPAPGVGEGAAYAPADLGADAIRVTRGRPRSNFRQVTKASQEGLPEHWTRATFIVREDLLDTLKDYAYTQRLTIRDVMQEALTAYLHGKKVIHRRK